MFLKTGCPCFGGSLEEERSHHCGTGFLRDAAAAPSSGKLSWLPGRFKRERGFRALGDNEVVGEGVGELVGADLAG